MSNTPVGLETFDRGSDSEHLERYEIVPDWWDGETMRRSAVPLELTGLPVVACIDRCSCTMPLTDSVLADVDLPAGASGFLFVGDDGDSLWFWPQNEEVALRIEQSHEESIRRSLPFGVHRAISEGALVLCSYTRTNAAFQFPEHLTQAA